MSILVQKTPVCLSTHFLAKFLDSKRKLKSRTINWSFFQAKTSIVQFNSFCPSLYLAVANSLSADFHHLIILLMHHIIKK